MNDDTVSIKTGWEDYSKSALPYATPDQIRQLERSYYAGAMTLYCLLLKLDDTNELQFMTDLHNELVDFKDKTLAELEKEILAKDGRYSQH